MNVKITCSQASGAAHDAARDWSEKRYGKPIGKEASEGCWGAMHEAADPEPTRLVREAVNAARCLQHFVGQEFDSDAEGALEAFDRAFDAALANPIAREFLEGAE